MRSCSNRDLRIFTATAGSFGAVFKRDRQGDLLDAEDKILPPKTNPDKAVQLRDIHLENGMHCVDCHFQQDSHGDGHLYGETRNAVEVDCIDCHGTIGAKASLRTSAAARQVPAGTPAARRASHRENGKVYQRSMVDKDRAPWKTMTRAIRFQAAWRNDSHGWRNFCKRQHPQRSLRIPTSA